MTTSSSRHFPLRFVLIFGGELLDLHLNLQWVSTEQGGDLRERGPEFQLSSQIVEISL